MNGGRHHNAFHSTPGSAAPFYLVSSTSHFISQRLNRRHVSRASRRISRRDNPDQRQDADGERRRLPRDDHSGKPRGQRQQVDQLAQPDAGAQSDRSTQQRQEQSLAEKLPL